MDYLNVTILELEIGLRRNGARFQCTKTPPLSARTRRFTIPKFFFGFGPATALQGVDFDQNRANRLSGDSLTTTLIGRCRALERRQTAGSTAGLAHSRAPTPSVDADRCGRAAATRSETELTLE